MGRIMDSSEHARIVDYLMQYRGRIPGTQDLADKYAIAEKSRLLIQLDKFHQLGKHELDFEWCILLIHHFQYPMPTDL